MTFACCCLKETFVPFQVLKLLKVQQQLPPDVDRTGKTESPPFSIVRIGQADSVHPEVKKTVLLDTLIEFHVRQ
jgi:hypothetical protein